MQKNRSYTFLFLLLLGTWLGVDAQEIEVNPPAHIKSIVFNGPNQDDQFPVAKLGERIQLSFDDILYDQADYFYTIIHCDHDWQPSQLTKGQYLKGVDNVRIRNHENSFNTIQLYTHFELTLPNAQTSLLVSGNYVLKVWDQDQNLMFARRFVIYETLVGVGVNLIRPRDLEAFGQKQTVQFQINAPNSLSLRNPEQEIKVCILQNYQWDTAITDLKPQYALGNELIYRYDTETSFWGSNEFFFVDTKDLRAPTANIARIEVFDVYEHFLFPNRARAGDVYTFNPDVNGNFRINVLGGDPRVQADYTFVHFKLLYDEPLEQGDEIHVFGRFNNFIPDAITRMQYNEESGLYETAILLKQGFYNYKYVIEKANGTIDQVSISGSHMVTENDYLVLVYFRKFGELFDSLIGIGSGTSINLRN